MNWDAIGAVGQVLGSVAVFVTLGYLAVQVRHARLEARSAARRARLGANHEVLLAVVNNSDLTAALAALESATGNEPVGFERVLADLGLTGAQCRQVSAWMALWWEGMEMTLTALEHLDADELAAFDSGAKGFLAGELVAKWYELNKPILNPSSVLYIDNLIAQPG